MGRSRRALLRSGGAMCALGLAGCLGGSGDGPGAGTATPSAEAVGSEQWSYDYESTFDSVLVPSVAENVVVGGAFGSVVGVDRSNGETLWELGIGSENQRPALTEGGAYVSSKQGGVWGLLPE